MASPPGYRALLGNRRFVFFQASTTAATVGYSVYAISVPWLALRLTGSLLVVGLVLFVEFAIYTLTFLVAPWVDRSPDKRRIFLLTYPPMAAAALALGGLLLLGRLNPAELLALVAVISALWDLAWAAANVVPPMLLGADELFRAQGLGGVLTGVAQVAGYGVGAGLLVLIGPGGGMLLYGGLLAGAAILVLPIRLRASPGPPRREYRTDFAEGWRLFRPAAGGPLFPLGLAEALRGFLVAGPTLLITLVAASLFAGSAGAYGLLFSAWIVGGVAAGLLVGARNPRGRVGHVLLGAALAEGTGILGATVVAPSLIAGSAFWALAGGAGAAYLATLYAYVQGAHPPGAVGRVFANLYLFTGTSTAAGALVLSAVAARSGPTVLGLMVGLGMLAVAGTFAATARLRRMAF